MTPSGVKAPYELTITIDDAAGRLQPYSDVPAKQDKCNLDTSSVRVTRHQVRMLPCRLLLHRQYIWGWVLGSPVSSSTALRRLRQEAGSGLRFAAGALPQTHHHRCCACQSRSFLVAAISAPQSPTATWQSARLRPLPQRCSGLKLSAAMLSGKACPRLTLPTMTTTGLPLGGGTAICARILQLWQQSAVCVAQYKLGQKWQCVRTDQLDSMTERMRLIPSR